MNISGLYISHEVILVLQTCEAAVLHMVTAIRCYARLVYCQRYGVDTGCENSYGVFVFSRRVDCVNGSD